VVDDDRAVAIKQDSRSGTWSRCSWHRPALAARRRVRLSLAWACCRQCADTAEINRRYVHSVTSLRWLALGTFGLGVHMNSQRVAV